ncbi:hypothetical protein NY751_21990 [Xanthomonas campestris]|uniref:hypothetical protein n=1 Tax=Xanthomonas campestris TaxID=339 RepID=UPI0023585E5C|nr:hypothetical protein [Xanthomonas campestris]MDC8748668.1 hypothetical protein [Xanthomonas campestris]
MSTPVTCRQTFFTCDPEQEYIKALLSMAYEDHDKNISTAFASTPSIRPRLSVSRKANPSSEG